MLGLNVDCGDTNSSWSTGNGLQKLRKNIVEIGNQKNGDHPEYSIVKVGLQTSTYD